MSRKSPKKLSKRPAAVKPRQSKKELILTLLRRKDGACVAEMMAATGWQAHSVRGFLSGTVKNSLGLKLTSQKRDGATRCYHVGKQS